MIELIQLVKLNSGKKKYKAIFNINGKKKSTTFGARGYSDYTIHKDINRRNRYIARHLVDLKTKDPTRAGYLSMYIIWNYPTVEKSVVDYKKRLKVYNNTGVFPTKIKNYSNNFGTESSLVKVLSQENIPYIPRELYLKIKRQLDQFYLKQKIAATKVNKSIKTWLPQRREPYYLKQKFEELKYDYMPQSETTVIYLKSLLKLTKNKILKDHFEYLKNIYNMFIETENVLWKPNEKINVQLSQNFFIKIMKKFDITIDIDNFYQNIKTEQVEEFFLSFNFGKNKFGESPVPDNVVDKELYKKIKIMVRKDVDAQNRRWGLYDSSRLVKKYKESGGKYFGKSENGTTRWYKEKWINACVWPKVEPCGRKDMTKSIAYCRPSIKVSKKTPKLVQELTQQEIKKRCFLKKNNPKLLL